MNTLLRIDASVRPHGSFSRKLGNYFEELWLNEYPEAKVLRCDLRMITIPHLSEQMTDAFYQEEKFPDILKLSDQLINDLKEADVILVTTPFYNYSIPSTLKAYLDHVVRINHTFVYRDDGKHQGLLHGKQAVIVTSKGGVFKGTDYSHLDFQEPYLRTILNFIGIDRVKIFSLEGTATRSDLEYVVFEIKIEIENFINSLTYEHK
jgi:FMN-dependent NADH-azoreductase